MNYCPALVSWFCRSLSQIHHWERRDSVSPRHAGAPQPETTGDESLSSRRALAGLSSREENTASIHKRTDRILVSNTVFLCFPRIMGFPQPTLISDIGPILADTLIISGYIGLCLLPSSEYCSCFRWRWRRQNNFVNAPFCHDEDAMLTSSMWVVDD